MLTKTELKQLWNKYDFKPIKRLGQNFLIDKNIKDKILRNLELHPDDIVIEIGAGFGELTFDIAKYVKKVFAVEKDRKIVEILKNAFDMPNNVILFEEDFLNLDIKTMVKNRKTLIYSNLPYYITTPIMEKLFSNISVIKTLYFVVQREVGNRILATPGSKNMGRLGLYVQYYTEPKKIFRIAKGAFYPEPKVESLFLRLDALRGKKVQVKDEDMLFKVIKAVYSQRRKTILNSLSNLGPDKKMLSTLLKKVGLNPSARAEELSLQDFARLVNML